MRLLHAAWRRIACTLWPHRFGIWIEIGQGFTADAPTLHLRQCVRCHAFEHGLRHPEGHVVPVKRC